MTDLKRELDFTFNVRCGEKDREITSAELKEHVRWHGLERYAPGRYSTLFVLNLMLLDEVQGINPQEATEEIRYLEGMRSSLQTKAEAPFRGPHLSGLWHKHFMPALPSVMATNICNQLGKDGTRQIVRQVMDPDKSPVVTREMISEVAERIVEGSIEQRGQQGKLTGEWIIYAKKNEKNVYLGIWPHVSADESIASSIRSACVPEFPFLDEVLPERIQK